MFDVDFCAQIGGYPKGSVLLSNDKTKKYTSLIDNNTSNFNVSVDPSKWVQSGLTETEVKAIAWGDGQTSAPWLKRHPSGTTIPTVYAGDVIYIGGDKYEWIGGAYVQIKPLHNSVSISANNTTTSCSITMTVPKSGVFLINGVRNAATSETTSSHYSRIMLNGSPISSDNTQTTISHSVTSNVAAGTHTIMLEGQFSIAFSLWLSVLYVPN